MEKEIELALVIMKDLVHVQQELFNDKMFDIRFDLI